MQTSISVRIEAIRNSMKTHALDAYIIPSFDPHQSEYVAAHWEVRKWISGFTGSAGTVVITDDHFGLWTDSRYYLQGKNEISPNGGILHKDQLVPFQYIYWLAKNLAAGSVIGLDGKVFPAKAIVKIRKILEDHNLQLESFDLVNEIWNDRPPLPKEEIFVFDEKYAGKSCATKIAEIREKIEQKQVDSMLITALDEIAWTLNIRGKDVDFNPVTYAYLYISKKDVILFVDEEKLNEGVKSYFDQYAITVQPYHKVAFFLEKLAIDHHIWANLNQMSYALYERIQAEIHDAELPTCLMKALKNEIEIGHIRNAMIKDGVALTRTFRWLEESLKSGYVKETEVAEKLQQFRAQQAGYQSESFAAIVGYKGNGAIIHYRAVEDRCANIAPNGMLLVDSGGQYIDGTTDITRTFCFDEPTAEQKKAYTAVLKGHIALNLMVFPKGTTGVQLDTIARQHLWKFGMNYGHGTGHGVGFYMNVHEMPQAIKANPSGKAATVFQAGMFTSNEPGFYKEGAFGIRIENLILCVEKEMDNGNVYLSFENLTLYPIATNLIDKSLLTTPEIDWLNKYHQKVFNILAPHLSEGEKEWLKPQCEPI